MSVEAPERPNKQSADDVHNPSIKDYDQKFNNQVGGYKSTADELKELEDYANNAEFGDMDDIERYANNSANGTGRIKGIEEAEKYANNPANNIGSTKEKEEAGGWQNSYTGGHQGKQEVKGKFDIRKGGPLGIILALVTGVGGLGFFGTSLLPISLTEGLINDTNDVNNTQRVHSLRLFGKKLGGVQKKLSFCGGKVSIRCKFNTLDEKTAQKFKDKGFSFGDETKVKGGRIAFSSMKFPDTEGGEGATVRSVKELANHLNAVPGAAAVFNSVYSFKNQLLVVGKWITTALKTAGVNKLKKIKGNNKEEVDKSYEKATKGGPPGEDLSTKATTEEAKEGATDAEKAELAGKNTTGNALSDTINKAIAGGKKLKTLSLKLTNAIVIPQLACLTYNMANLISISAKTVKAVRLANFAMIFLTLASSIKARTETAAEVEKGATVLVPSSYPEQKQDPETGQWVPNPDIGKNATDSPVVKAALYGDPVNLDKWVKRFFVAGGFLGALDKIISWMQNNIPGGKEAIRTTCKIVNSTAATIIGFLAAPVFAVAMTGLTKILPLEEWAADLVNLAIDAAAGADLTTSITGPDAGTALFMGTAGIMSVIGFSYGMKPGKLPSIKKNLVDNNEALKQDIAVEQYNAKKTPFAITNRYSLLGSLAYSFAPYMPQGGESPLVSFGKVLSSIPNAVGSLSKTAGAAYSMPVANYPDSRFNQCTDEQYAALKKYFDPDMGCVLRMVPNEHPVQDPNVAIDYMEKNGYVDVDSDTGTPKPGTDFEKWTKYCTAPGRTDPIGSTSVPAEEQTDDPKWYTGEKCFEGTPVTLEDTNDDGQKYQLKTTVFDIFSDYKGYTISNDNIDATRPADNANVQTGFMSDPTQTDGTSTNALASMWQSLTMAWGK